jgi:hypothetical protein
MSYSSFSYACLFVPQTFPLFVGREATSLPISVYFPKAHPSRILLLFSFLRCESLLTFCSHLIISFSLGRLPLVLHSKWDFTFILSYNVPFSSPFCYLSVHQHSPLSYRMLSSSFSFCLPRHSSSG